MKCHVVTYRTVRIFCLCPLSFLSAGNGLTEIPAGVAALKSLRTLDVSNNSLKRLPSELESLQSLTTIRLNGNELEQGALRELLRRRPTLRIVEANELEAHARVQAQVLDDAGEEATVTRKHPGS